MTSNTLVPILEHRLPEFVRESYPNFVSWIKDYLTWLEQDENFLRIIEDWRQNNEPSNNAEPYITAILKDLGFEAGQGLYVTKDVLLHTLRDFYLARGSEASFRWLFRVLFNADVEIRYPRLEMLIPSYAEYGERHFIFTSALNRNTEAFESALAYIRENGGVLDGVTSGAESNIQNITIIYGQGTPFLQIEILKPLIEFEVGEQVNIIAGATVSEEVQPVLSVNIVDAGAGYKSDDQIVVTGIQLQGLAAVDSTFAGGIDSVVISDPGAGYAVNDMVRASSTDDGFGFSAKVTQVDGSGGIQNIKVTSRGYNYETIPDVFIHAGSDQAILHGVSDEIGAIQSIRISDPFVGFTDANISVISDEGLGANLEALPVSRWVTRGWNDNRGVIAEACTLIDSDKYQQFSYQVVSSIPATQYDDYVDDLLHPMGFIRTSSFEIVSGITLNLTGSDSDVYTDLELIYETNLNLTFTSAYEITSIYTDSIVDDTGVTIITSDDDQIVFT